MVMSNFKESEERPFFHVLEDGEQEICTET